MKNKTIKQLLNSLYGINSTHGITTPKTHREQFHRWLNYHNLQYLECPTGIIETAFTGRDGTVRIYATFLAEGEFYIGKVCVKDLTIVLTAKDYPCFMSALNTLYTIETHEFCWKLCRIV